MKEIKKSRMTDKQWEELFIRCHESATGLRKIIDKDNVDNDKNKVKQEDL